MLRRLVMVAILALWVLVGCSRQDGPTTTELTPTPPRTPTDDAGAPDLPAALERDSAGAPRTGRGFVPLDNPLFIGADDAKYLVDEELILGVERGQSTPWEIRGVTTFNSHTIDE